MDRHYGRTIFILSFMLSCAILFSTACGGNQVPVEPTTVPTPAVQLALPKITSVVSDRNEVPRYESIELNLDLDAEYSNPYDAREVALEGLFTGPGGSTMTIPGFWDGEASWKIRFTPSQEGLWTYSISVADARGNSLPHLGEFTVTSSDLHGWVQPGHLFDSAYSGRYLVHHDGTPFYGVGHADALNILIDGFDLEDGVRLFDTMKAANENYVVWWPLYTNSPVNSSYDDYSVGNMKVIDAVVRDAEKKGILLIFTIWDHPQLRDDNHPSWDTGNWSRNGFSKLSELNDFFVSEEAWAWQENLYRYIIARWGYSPAIGMWQTVSEINGTNSLDQTDAWHERVNTYFVENDPYRHPTTASGSGEVDWTEGHTVMDVPQVHLYAFNEDAVSAAQVIADWTSLMWERNEKPNWIGEFGMTGNTHYPELFHNSIWAALTAGAALTPAEWNSGGAWGRMTPEMNADISRFAQFVSDMPLAAWDPSKLEITVSEAQVRAWGLSGVDGGFFWVQDFSLTGMPIDQVRISMPLRTGTQVDVHGIASGSYIIQPYDTWQGAYLDTFDVECPDGAACVIDLPDFSSDMAFKIIRK
ncbi:MAG TPA: DUF5060 domain-containing protein [Anaerolineales bacterium]|nr:DUF5060 domain-containing protein [Anaerolineales bacterium]